MKRKNVLLGITAAAVLGLFNPAFAGGDSVKNKTDAKANTRSETKLPEGNASAGSANAGAGASADIGKDKKSDDKQQSNTKEKQRQN